MSNVSYRVMVKKQFNNNVWSCLINSSVIWIYTAFEFKVYDTIFYSLHLLCINGLLIWIRFTYFQMAYVDTGALWRSRLTKSSNIMAGHTTSYYSFIQGVRQFLENHFKSLLVVLYIFMRWQINEHQKDALIITKDSGLM